MHIIVVARLSSPIMYLYVISACYIVLDIVSEKPVSLGLRSLCWCIHANSRPDSGGRLTIFEAKKLLYFRSPSCIRFNRKLGGKSIPQIFVSPNLPLSFSKMLVCMLVYFEDHRFWATCTFEMLPVICQRPVHL